MRNVSDHAGAGHHAGAGRAGVPVADDQATAVTALVATLERTLNDRGWGQLPLVATIHSLPLLPGLAGLALATVPLEAADWSTRCDPIEVLEALTEIVAPPGGPDPQLAGLRDWPGPLVGWLFAIETSSRSSLAGPRARLVLAVDTAGAAYQASRYDGDEQASVGSLTHPCPAVAAHPIYRCLARMAAPPRQR